MSATARDITIITAGAGSGKTYRIVTKITEAILGGVDPARIIATTFTRKAATELSSRIRERLIKKGRVADARRIESALIGTVNSVCGSLLSRFSYRVGLPSHSRHDSILARSFLVLARPNMFPTFGFLVLSNSNYTPKYWSRTLQL